MLNLARGTCRSTSSTLIVYRLVAPGGVWRGTLRLGGASYGRVRGKAAKVAKVAKVASFHDSSKAKSYLR